MMAGFHLAASLYRVMLWFTRAHQNLSRRLAIVDMLGNARVFPSVTSQRLFCCGPKMASTPQQTSSGM